MRVTDIVRLYAAAAGESHVETVQVPPTPQDDAPPWHPMNLSAFSPATRDAFCEIPSGGVGGWHATPCRQVFSRLAGGVEITASDGEVRRFPAGRVLLVEDTTGKGRYRRTVGVDTLAAVVRLPDR